MANEGKVAGSLLYTGVTVDPNARVAANDLYAVVDASANARLAGNDLYVVTAADVNSRVAGLMLYLVVEDVPFVPSGPGISPQGDVGQGYIDQSGVPISQGQSCYMQGLLPQGR